jgi:hypothetical protein
MDQIRAPSQRNGIDVLYARIYVCYHPNMASAPYISVRLSRREISPNTSGFLPRTYSLNRCLKAMNEAIPDVSDWPT